MAKQSYKSEKSTASNQRNCLDLMNSGEDHIPQASMMKKSKRRGRKRVLSEPTQVEPEDKSTQSKKPKAQADPGPRRKRPKTEAVTVSNSTEQQLPAERTKNVLMSISRGEFIMERWVFVCVSAKCLCNSSKIQTVCRWIWEELPGSWEDWRRWFWNCVFWL